ncbi:SDR family NAD(P)-dependent oxidoreductase [Candidatus Nitrosopumilus sediminis]|uniref:Short-chain dehydrogenase/reductase SDR n=1 Tax=Candidatus Nitrosopumilus sediminis TaxID=1229909 RepID=K0BFA7_9ARCH|nr:SDR family NAD(P)-dependent oxidoreductase [Candidatus Nitrosopumilus sediminis]AFS83757.1 short-chain dehydrogenase/reductase SDR [Candidatus Nitrosopumilus sediminis]
MDFKNKIVLITGASSGIGRESAIEFAKLGANVVLVSRRKDKLEQVANELKKFNVTTMICQCDVSDKNQVKEMSKMVLEKFNSVDILVNNAGFAIYGSVSELSIDEIESQMKTNYFGMIYCIKNFLPSMLVKKSGHIVNVASVAASFGLPGIASYCASKFAMLGFSEGLKHELKNSGVGITVVSPIMVRTDFFEHPSFEKMPKFSPTSLSSKTVAKAILKAANSPRLEIIVPSVVRGAVWMKNTFPYFVNPILGKSFKKQLDSMKNAKIYSSKSSSADSLEPTSSNSNDFNSN